MKRFTPLISFAKEISLIWSQDRPVQLAASLAYYGLFSFAPIIYIAFTVAGFFLNQEILAQRLIDSLTSMLGPEIVAAIQTMMGSIDIPTEEGTWIASLISLGALLYAATGVFYQLKFSLNSLWKIPPSQKGGIIEMVRGRLLAFVITIGVGLLLLAAGVLSMLSSWIRSFFDIAWILPGYSVLVFIFLATCSIAILYKILPDIKIGWRDVWIGALTAALLITLAVWVISFLIGISTFQSALEATGSFVILLLGINYLAQIFLGGAIITRVYARRYGSLKDSA